MMFGCTPCIAMGPAGTLELGGRVTSPAPKSTKPLDGSPPTDTTVKGYSYIVSSSYSEVLFISFFRLQLALSVRSAPATRTTGLCNMCKHPLCRSAPLGGPDLHQSAPSDSCNLHHALYNEPAYFGVDLDGSRLMPDFSLLQPGACVRFQYRSKQGTSSTAFRIAIVGHQGKNSDTRAAEREPVERLVVLHEKSNNKCCVRSAVITPHSKIPIY